MCSTSKEQFSGTKYFVIIYLEKHKICKWLERMWHSYVSSLALEGLIVIGTKG